MILDVVSLTRNLGRHFATKSVANTVAKLKKPPPNAGKGEMCAQGDLNPHTS